LAAGGGFEEVPLFAENTGRGVGGAASGAAGGTGTTFASARRDIIAIGTACTSASGITGQVQLASIVLQSVTQEAG
jgi:hypothetical protein